MKEVKEITNMDEDFAQWFTDVCTKAELIDYSSVKGLYIYRPYGYAIWENIQRILDERFRETGHENVYLPMLIPESLLQKEADHVEGFAPECAWVTYGGSNSLEERYCIRPTSETLFCEHYKNIIHSYKDLPKLYNQWCSVLRWEKSARPFLRHREFLWQEGHTMHETAEEARAETQQMLNIYADFMQQVLAMPVVKGQKTDKEKFNGAEETYTVECMMHDRKALQAGTSHYFGDGFSKAFDITFSGKDNHLHYPHQTSWGVSTRMIGGIIMTHGDNNGLILPPGIAPVQVIVIPVLPHKEGVLEAAGALVDRLKKAGIRVKMDTTDHSFGWKAAEYEMKGVPLRLEIGPKDLANNACCMCRRDNGEKQSVPFDEVETKAADLLNAIHDSLYERALENRKDHTRVCRTLDEVKTFMQKEGGFAKTMWCGSLECEVRMKEEAGVTSRCIPFKQEKVGDACVCCGKPANKMIYWGVAY